MILVSVFSVAVLSPVATAMQRRLRGSRALCSTVLVLGIVIAIAVVVLVLVRAISDAVSGFSDDLPQILGKVRHSDLGDSINSGSGFLDTLREHATDITKGVATVPGGVADVGVSAFGAVTLLRRHGNRGVAYLAAARSAAARTWVARRGDPAPASAPAGRAPRAPHADHFSASSTSTRSPSDLQSLAAADSCR